MARTVIGMLSGSCPCQRLEVQVDHASPDGRMRVTLVEQHFAQGIGWFDQRSIQLDAWQWKQLKGMFGRIEAGIGERQELAARDVLPFPGLRQAEESAEPCPGERSCPMEPRSADVERTQQAV